MSSTYALGSALGSGEGDGGAVEFGAGRFEQLIRLRAGRFGDALPADHFRKLFDALCALDGAKAGLRLVPRDIFSDGEMTIRIAGDLREVRDAQNLVPLGERAQLAADDRPKPPADVRVDLIEDQHADAIPAGE